MDAVCPGRPTSDRIHNLLAGSSAPAACGRRPRARAVQRLDHGERQVVRHRKTAKPEAIRHDAKEVAP